MQYRFGYIKFKDMIDGILVFLVPRVLHSENVNAIPSSCTYKLSQNSNNE